MNKLFSQFFFFFKICVKTFSFIFQHFILIHLNLITRCRLIMQIQILLFRQRRHHCLCVLQLNNVQAFVNVLGSRFYCASYAVTIVYTSVLESQVIYRYLWIESFSSLDHHQFRIVYEGYHTCFIRFMHKQTSLQFATFETHMFCQNSSQKFCEISAGCSHAPCCLQIHPSRSCPFGGRANISQDESACMKAHTRSPVSTRRSNHAAYSNSPRTDNGEGVEANTSSLTVVAKSFSLHLDLTSLPFNRRARPVSRIDLLGSMSVSLTQECSCRSFICWISRAAPALTLSAGSPSIKAPSYVARIASLRLAKLPR